MYNSQPISHHRLPDSHHDLTALATIYATVSRQDGHRSDLLSESPEKGLFFHPNWYLWIGQHGDCRCRWPLLDSALKRRYLNFRSHLQISFFPVGAITGWMEIPTPWTFVCNHLPWPYNQSNGGPFSKMYPSLV